VLKQDENIFICDGERVTFFQLTRAEDNKWDVDTIADPTPRTSSVAIDFIIELVYEIERLETTIINIGEQVVETGAITPYEYRLPFWGDKNIPEFWAKTGANDLKWREALGNAE